ncbi:serine/threonine-protein kinase GRIK2 isoform X1 [Canna indica]|uniref:non-specific serine/threonine protein kinase n=1 Tax=Canna indica TaxID=4628 RepID=A0AAQ3L3A6_9LILI|nr:serine/threonine-protein kinase GRIK2 isoform X1 [Canna indica]
MDMGCCGCFGFLRKPHRSQECLLPENMDDTDGSFYNRDTASFYESDSGLQHSVKRSEEILLWRAQNGLICREFPVKETRKVTLSEDDNGNKMVNEYVRECKIGSGSYGKVVLYRSTKDGKQYAIKIFHKSHLLKLRVAPSETAMTDVLREVAIMKMLGHPNIVNLVEVIDDPDTDNFYMVLEYVEGKWMFEGCGAASGLDESTTRRYLRDIVAGLMYLHSHNVVHGDIKPDNLLVTRSNNIKIADFSVSQVFEDDNDVLRRSPGTPVFTAPECCLDLSYHGKAADTWAVGVTLYCMVFGQYPFLGDTLQDTYDKIVNNPLIIPDEINPLLRSLLEGLLCKDPQNRITLHAVSEHPWVIEDEGPIPEYVCSRFVLNVPKEDLESFERILFLLEQAHWFYEDNSVEQNPSLKSLSFREFTSLMFKSCAALRPYIAHIDDIYKDFTSYKFRVPVTGAIILDESYERCLLVKGWKAGASWSFPRGKKSKDEEDHTCAVREVLEETGFDVSKILKMDQYIEVVIGQQRVRLYIIAGVKEDTVFAPLTKKEISEISWHRLDELQPAGDDAMSRGVNGLKLYMVAPFLTTLKSWIAEKSPPISQKSDTSSKAGTCVWKAKNSSEGATVSENSLNRVGSEPLKTDNGPGKSFRNFRFDTTSIFQAMEAAFAAN